MELREGGLLLRPWRPEDADAVYRACQDPLIQRWTGIPSPYTREHADGFVAGFAPQHWAARTRADLGVFDAATAELLGSSGLIALDLTCGTAEVGYWVAPWARGRGVATDSTRAVARWARALGVERLGWRAEVGNHASRLVAARIGVRFEGVARAAIRRYGGRDAWVGALLTGELRESDAPGDPALARATVRCHVFGRPQPTLQATTHRGEPIRLRPLELKDATACARACQDPLTTRYTTVPDPYDETHAESFINTDAPAAWARGTEAIFAVADDHDEFVGTMALRLPRDELYTTTGDVGYLVGPWARGRGYASAALRAVTDWGFASLALRRIEWQAYVGNAASRAAAEQAGFRIEGELRQSMIHRGTYKDIWIGARLATD
jgi:RimJ/RimL family protein N-acetyltransferase